MPEEKECEICACEYDNRNHVPRLLPCAHTICTDCLKRMTNRNTVECPFDRMSHQIRNGDVTLLPVNARLLNEASTANRTDERDDDQQDIAENQTPNNQQQETNQERWRNRLPPIHPAFRRHQSFIATTDDMSHDHHVSDFYDQIPPNDTADETQHTSRRNGIQHAPHRNYHNDRRMNESRRNNEGNQFRRRERDSRRNPNRGEGNRITLPPITQRYNEMVTKASLALNYVKGLANRIPRSIQSRDVRDPPYRQIQKVFADVFEHN